MASRTTIIAASLLALAGSSSAALCKAKDLKKSLPEIFGVKVLDLKASEVEQWNDYATSAPTVPFLPAPPTPIDFCNVYVEYTHPGLNDSIGVNVWLPLKDEDWNGRFLGQGGLGWAAGNPGALAGGVALGYATADTDAGHNIYGHPSETSLSSKSWSLTSPGNVNLHQLQTFGYRALEELTLIAKAVTKTYYNKDIAYSYWQGCSTGGRQGLTLAQRYPDLYQGVLAAAPAINWVTFLITEYFAHVEMKKLDYYPAACELDAITAAAIEACDDLDGVKDGIVAAHGQCKFDPLSIVGRTYDCEGDTRKITKEAAQIASVTWTGPIKDGKPVWYGLTPDTALTGLDPLYKGLARTTCDDKNKNCKSDPFPISADWIRHFILKDSDADFSKIDEEKFYDILRISHQQYHSIMDSALPDLRPYQKAGGKIITWHGLADQLIPPNGTIDYYKRVEAITPNIKDYFRHFETPGVGHCFAGPGPFPLTAFLSLVDWVEKGKAPEQLQAVSLPSPDGTPPAVQTTRPLCPYPQVASYKGGDINVAASFECADNFGSVKATHDEL